MASRTDTEGEAAAPLLSLADLVKEQHPDASTVLYDQRPARRIAKRSAGLLAA